jgi:selenocysteine-specific elongation factor
VAQAGDRFIIRRFSPLQTMGGGVVLDPSPPKRRKKEGLDDLAVFDRGALKERVAMKVRRAALTGMALPEVEGWVRAEAPEVKAALAGLKAERALYEVEGAYIHADAIKALMDAAVGMLGEFHRKNPLRPGLRKEEARERLKVEPRLFAGLLQFFPEVVVEKDLLRLQSFKAAVSSPDKDKVLEAIDRKGFQPPTVSELAAELKKGEKEVADILKLMQQDGSVVRLNESMCVSRKVYDDLVGLLKGHFRKKPEMTVAEFRDILGTTRKYALPFLEYLDSHGVTLRVGDVRKLMLK